jgi:hypothetical protein
VLSTPSQLASWELGGGDAVPGWRWGLAAAPEIGKACDGVTHVTEHRRIAIFEEGSLGDWALSSPMFRHHRHSVTGGQRGAVPCQAE